MDTRNTTQNTISGHKNRRQLSCYRLIVGKQRKAESLSAVRLLFLLFRSGFLLFPVPVRLDDYTDIPIIHIPDTGFTNPLSRHLSAKFSGGFFLVADKATKYFRAPVHFFESNNVNMFFLNPSPFNNHLDDRIHVGIPLRVHFYRAVHAVLNFGNANRHDRMTMPIVILLPGLPGDDDVAANFPVWSGKVGACSVDGFYILDCQS
jgi:hypothetical protein